MDFSLPIEEKELIRISFVFTNLKFFPSEILQSYTIVITYAQVLNFAM